MVRRPDPGRGGGGLLLPWERGPDMAAAAWPAPQLKPRRAGGRAQSLFPPPPPNTHRFRYYLILEHIQTKI